MNATQHIQRLALAGALTLIGLIGGGALASAQDEPQWEPDSYESMLTGYEIEVSGPDFAIEDVVHQEYSDGENEQVYIESDYATSQISFFDDSDTPQDTIELWLSDLRDGMDSLDVVDQGVDGDVTWYYAEGVYEDLDFVYYVQVQEDVDGNIDLLESVLTLDGNLVDAVDASQQDITVDGDPFMDDVDLDDLEAFLDGEPFRGSDGSSTPDSDTSGDRDATQQKDSGQESGGLDLESEGLTSGTTYESPQFGVEVEWDDTIWTADTEWELTAISDTESGIDSVVLIWTGGDASMIVEIMEVGNVEPADFVDTWTSDDYVAVDVHEDAEVLLSDSSMRRGAVMYRTYNNDGTELVQLQEVIALDDNLAAIVSLFTVPEDIGDAYADAEDFLTVDGEDAAGTFTAREVDRAIEP